MDRVCKFAAIERAAPDGGEFTVIASDETPDRYGDVIRVEGWDLKHYKTNPIVLWGHDHNRPIGTARVYKSAGRLMAAVKLAEAGTSSFIDFLRELVRQRIVRAVSVGFMPTRSPDPIVDPDTGGLKGYEFNGQELLELSVVSVPANPAALALAKSFRLSTAEQIAALGAVAGNPVAPGVAGNPTSKGKTMFTEQLARLRTRATDLGTLMEDISQRCADEERCMSAEETASFDSASAELDQINATIARTEKSVAMVGAPARAAANDPAAPAEPALPRVAALPSAPGAEPLFMRRNLPKATAFTRYVKALALAKGDPSAALNIMRNACADTPEVITVLKAAVAAGSTTSTDWASPLVEYQNMIGEFIDLLRPQTIVGRIPGFRQVPFNISIPRQNAGSSVGWVGEGAPAPVSKLAFDRVQMPHTKVAGIVVITKELARFSSPAAESAVRQDLIDTVRQFQDAQFVDPAVAGTEGKSPASIAYGLTPIPSKGESVALITDTVKAVLQAVSNANLPLNSGYWIMHPSTRISLAMLRTAQDILAFPEVANGSFRGFPIVDSNTVPSGMGTGNDETIVEFVVPNEVMIADDGEVEIEASDSAAVAMSDDGTGTLTSLWQNGLIGVKAVRPMHWMRRREAAVQLVSGVKW